MGIMVVVVGVLVMIALLSCSKKDRNNPLDSNVASVSSPFVLTAGSNLKFCGLLLADIGKNLQHKQQTYSAELDKKVNLVYNYYYGLARAKLSTPYIFAAFWLARLQTQRNAQRFPERINPWLDASVS